MTAIQVEEASVSFDGTPVLRGVSMSVPRGSWLGLIGANGAGKTTLLRAVAGLVQCSGRLRLDDTPVSALSRRALASLVAFVPQRPSIPRSMTVTDYVLMGRTPYIPYLGVESSRDLGIVDDALVRLELRALADRTLGSLSGGELQRAVLARALAQQAPVLLLDEPTSSLDIGHQQQVLELVDALRIDHELTVVSAMHDLTLVGQFADRLLLLHEGRAAAWGPPASVLTEEVIARHYGAAVRVVQDGRGRVLVLPVRSERGAPRTEETVT